MSLCHGSFDIFRSFLPVNTPSQKKFEKVLIGRFDVSQLYIGRYTPMRARYLYPVARCRAKPSRYLGKRPRLRSRSKAPPIELVVMIRPNLRLHLVASTMF